VTAKKTTATTTKTKKPARAKRPAPPPPVAEAVSLALAVNVARRAAYAAQEGRLTGKRLEQAAHAADRFIAVLDKLLPGRRATP
jgi:hypothetical protein